MTIHLATQQLIFQLMHLYEEREARNIADLVMENVTEWKRIDRVVNKQVTLSAGKQELLARYTEELLSQKPVHYVLNEAWFHGMKLYVNEYVLIPRPETEELAEWIIRDALAGNYPGKNQALRIMDIGTGSGCIPIALKKKIPGATVYGCDVSDRALQVAGVNAAAHQTDILFILCDFLQEDERKDLPGVDILVSNPPYIPESSKKDMRPNVVNFEPRLALFVPDEDPLVFYAALASFAQTHLSKGGAVYVEIHEELGTAVKELFLKNRFGRVELKQDLQGRDRMIRAGF